MRTQARRDAKQMQPIRSIEAFVMRVPLARPRGPSTYTYRHRETLVVRVTDGDATGWGETYVRPGCLESLRAAAAIIIGRDTSHPGVLLSELAFHVADRLVVSAVAIALDDLRSRRLGLSVAELYGGPRRTTVDAYASSGGYDPNESPDHTWREEVPALMERGFKTIKLRIGRFEPRTEAAWLRSLRDATPSAIAFAADANAAYAMADALQMGRVLGELGFLWFEEPLPRTEYLGYRTLTARLQVPIAGGEDIESFGAASRLIADGAFDIIQPDVMTCGGVGESTLIAQLAAVVNLTTIPHAWSGGIGLAATLQLLAVLPGPSEPVQTSPLLEFDAGENPFLEGLLSKPISVHDGRVAIPGGPGLGIEVAADWIRSNATAHVSVDR